MEVVQATKYEGSIRKGEGGLGTESLCTKNGLQIAFFPTMVTSVSGGVGGNPPSSCGVWPFEYLPA